MRNNKYTDTCLIRIQKETRDLLKARCKEENRLMGGYADTIIKIALSNTEPEVKVESSSKDA